MLFFRNGNKGYHKFVAKIDFNNDVSDYLLGFIEQFGDGPLGELDPEEWTTLNFLEWLKLNKYKIVKND